MICIHLSSTDPCFNLAAEEYLLKKTSMDFFMLYRNAPSIIVGKHQNAYAEINLDFVRKNNIRLIRRISGGGTVWHDLGNLNYSFIRNGEKGKLVDFERYTRPVMDFLSTLGLQVHHDGRNSLVHQGKKISGNAEHVHQDRVLHHGTLLFSSVLDNLEEALRPVHEYYHDKAIRSIRSQVTNLSDHLDPAMTIESFARRLYAYIMDYFEDSTRYEFTAGDHEEINQLIRDKYSTWEWNYGYSPKYRLVREIVISGTLLTLTLDVEQGLITSLDLSGEQTVPHLQEQLGRELTGLPHSWDVIQKHLTECMKMENKEDLQCLTEGFF
jgi:lipoate-protein ligase A